MSAYREQRHIDAPVAVVWELVGDPKRHPEWWPRVIDVRGERFAEGEEYVQVTRSPMGQVETEFLIEHRDDLREIHLSCQKTGTYARWLMTEAQGGTFVDLRLGMQPEGFYDRLFDTTVGRLYFRRWIAQSVDALHRAAALEAASPTK